MFPVVVVFFSIVFLVFLRDTVRLRLRHVSCPSLIVLTPQVLVVEKNEREHGSSVAAQLLPVSDTTPSFSLLTDS